MIRKGTKKDLKKSISVKDMEEELPTIVSFNEDEQYCDVRFILPKEASKSTHQSTTVLRITNSTTPLDVFESLYEKEKVKKEDAPEGLSLYQKGIEGSIHISNTEHLIERCKKWRMHGTEKGNKFVLKHNMEYLKFYLADDKKSFWMFRVTATTKARDIIEMVSERMDLSFTMYEKISHRKVDDDALILFLYNTWKESNDQFVLKSTGPRVKKEEVSLPLDFGEEEVTCSIGELKIEEKWKIDPVDVKLTKVVGGGNFAQVISGTYKDQTVAIKKMLNTDTYEMQKYVQRELALLQSLHHPNIVEFKGAFQTEKAVFIITEFVTKGDLRNLIDDETMHLSWKLRVKIASDIAAALGYLKTQNFIHRDLKSENLLVQPNFIIKLCDFGLARDYDQTSPKSRAMTIVGTDEFMAPELILGEEYNEKADIFSFGMVLVELITRNRPPMREPRNLFEFPENEFKKEVPEDCPEGFLALTLACAKSEPDQRPHIEEIIKALQMLDSQIEDDTKQ